MKRITRVFLLIIIVTLAGCGRNPLQSMSAVNDYQKGVENYESGNYEDAIECFATAVDNELPDKLTVYAYSYMGHCHFAQENLADAEAMYQSALATGRESAMCNTNLGILYRTCEAYEKAEQYYLTALEADSSYAQALTSLGVLYSVSGRAEEAVSLLEQAIAAEAESSAVYHANLAYAYACVGRFAQAREQLAIADQKGYSKADYESILAYIEASMPSVTGAPEQAE